MSYYACGSGDVLLKKDAPVEKVIKILEDVFDDVTRTEEWRGPREDGVEVEVCHDSGFHSDEALEALAEINPFTVKGEIYMRGEGGDVWRYRFADGCWGEEQGRVLYEEARRDTCFIPIYTVLKGGAIIKSFPSREQAEYFCREEEKAGRGTCEIAETALAI